MVYKRECPLCLKEITYKSKVGFDNSCKNESVCRSCASKGENNGMYGKKGKLNPFFNKKHSKETIEKLKKVDRGYTKTEKFRSKMSILNSGKNNPMYGKSLYDVWGEKYGEEVAIEKLNSYKEKQSLLNSGENNSMYGKPSPIGSGNGWSGWYKGWYFRSLRELTYMIKIIERYNLEWENGEKKKWCVEYYNFEGLKRNYYPDFIINNKYMIESKPKKLWGSDTVLNKKEGAIIFCEKNNLKYKLTDVGLLSESEIDYLYENNLIKFIERYEIKYKKRKESLSGVNHHERDSLTRSW